MNFSSDVVINGADDDVEIAMEIDRNDSLVLSTSNEDPFWTKEQLLLLKGSFFAAECWKEVIFAPRNAYLSLLYQGDIA